MVSSEKYRFDFAERVARLAEVRHPRIKQAFAAVPRESFVPPPPWTVTSLGTTTQTRELSDLYDNVLVAIDRERGINNGEPVLHAAWLGAVDPRPSETVIHVGTGLGYYTAILARLVAPNGRVEAYEYEPDLAAQAARNLQSYPQVKVHAASAFGNVLPKADVIYVNAGVVAPDVEWLRALNPGGRLIFPWHPNGDWGPAVLVTRRPGGFSAKPIMKVGFISCSGATEASGGRFEPADADLAAIRSLWPRTERAPDGTAVAVYERVWFSSSEIESSARES